MDGLRQNIQRELAREPTERGEAPTGSNPGAEPAVAVAEPESPAATLQLMEEVCERENLVRAWQRVRENKGAPGVDGMTIDASLFVYHSVIIEHPFPYIRDKNTIRSGQIHDTIMLYQWFFCFSNRNGH